MKEKANNIDIHFLIYSYKTKYVYGFINGEVEKILKMFPGINMDKFYEAMRGDTRMMIDEQTIIYHCDLEKALRCGTENRNITFTEFDQKSIHIVATLRLHLQNQNYKEFETKVIYYGYTKLIDVDVPEVDKPYMVTIWKRGYGDDVKLVTIGRYLFNPFSGKKEWDHEDRMIAYAELPEPYNE